MTDVKVTAEESYVLMDNNTIRLVPEHCKQLGWEEDRTVLAMYVDQKRGWIYLVEREDLMAKLPADYFFYAKPVLGKKFRIGKRRTVYIPETAQKFLGIGSGCRLAQEINLNINGVIAKKQENENG